MCFWRFRGSFFPLQLWVCKVHDRSGSFKLCLAFSAGRLHPSLSLSLSLALFLSLSLSLSQPHLPHVHFTFPLSLLSPQKKRERERNNAHTATRLRRQIAFILGLIIADCVSLRKCALITQDNWIKPRVSVLIITPSFFSCDSLRIYSRIRSSRLKSVTVMNGNNKDCTLWIRREACAMNKSCF